MKTFDINKVAEVTLNYKTKIKASERPQIASSKDVYEIFYNTWDNFIEHSESMKLLLLNRANRVLGLVNLSSGGTTGCIIDSKIIFQAALLAHASSIVLAHNHPSGNSQPSNIDIETTKKIKNAGQLLDISLLDHIIITPFDNYYSMADEGVI